MNLVLLGKPGSGKGTQAVLLEKKLGLFYLAAGDLARKISKGNPRIAKIMQEGELIPEKEMSKYVLDYLEQKAPTGENILFEGWPRFVSQYHVLEAWLAKRDSKVDVVVHLDVDEETVVRRLGARRVCEKCGTVYNLITDPPPSPTTCKCGGKLMTRSDDNPESIRERFAEYEANTAKVVEYAAELGLLIEVDATKRVDEVQVDILTKLKEFLPTQF